ncbi:TTLL3C, partial [Symbiodinium sp. KB8]
AAALVVKAVNLSLFRFIAWTPLVLYVSLTALLPQETHWVVQRYIERPLVVFQRKFDIRQWVLVTSWNPLQVWFFKECYLRFCVYDFTLDDLGNKFVHLSNNSIQKYSKRFNRTEIEGNMWHSDDFANHLKEKEGYDVWSTKIHPQMKRIVTWSVQSAQDMVSVEELQPAAAADSCHWLRLLSLLCLTQIESRQGSFELYGYDFMVDADYNPWLIEINSSPDFSYSTDVTKRLVKGAGVDTMKVVLDH